MNNTINQYLVFQKQINALDLAIKTINYDHVTIAPKNGAPYRIDMLTHLQGERFTLQNDPQRIALLTQMSEMHDEPMWQREAQLQLEAYHKLNCIPKAVFMEYSRLCMEGEMVWEEAKKAKDFSKFAPVLKQLVTMSKQIYTYRGSDRDIYELMLDDYEIGASTAMYDEFFEKIKLELVPLIKQLTSQPATLPVDVYPISKQQELLKRLTEYLRFPTDNLYMGVSAHPFSSTFSIHDARITTRYDENDLFSSVYSLIHELGHANYNSQVDPKYEGMLIADAMSSGMHESQSRLYENYLGRRSSFWLKNLSHLQELFPKQLQGITLSQVMNIVNHACPSLIRVEADELTYSIHILIRYEIERGLFDGTIDVEELEMVWNQKMEDYLGVTVTNPAEGVLQDIHWSGGAFGYFPTYALGSAYAAQFMHQMEQDLPVDHLLAQGDVDTINQWLKSNIHHDGAYLLPQEVLLRATKEKFNPQYYIDYLKNKFSK
jgi:carboxypeptidase Taq